MQNSLSFAGVATHVTPDVTDGDSDERLIARIAGGDRRAMTILYARHHVRVYRFVLRLVSNATNAEDLTSEVFLEVWKRACRYERRSQVSTWMLAIARYKAISALRIRTNDQLDDATAADIPDSADDPEVMLQKQHDVALLRQCLTQLSPSHREIIDLVYYHGKSIIEVAEITGIAQNTVKTRMFYARKRLAELFGANGIGAAA
jgi:RNA polymerase sigma-70 factor (ECF subfamily)